MPKKILIVDDDRDIRTGLNIRLRGMGYETAFAVDGIQAIAQAQSTQPDMILLDLGLPAGDGFTVLERLGSITQLSAIPVIVISAKSGAEEKALKAGATAFFQKPVNDDELLYTISAQIGA